jgi:quercetin dioxygenase-like cupin family protein
MPIVRRGEELGGDVRKPEGGFTGDADQRPLHVQEGETVRVSFVRFQPRARTHWHSHGGGQVLHVVEGEAEVQDRGGAVQRLGPGDTSIVAPGAEHWHGSAGDSPMTHLAVTIGEVRWAEPS